jgi:amidase
MSELHYLSITELAGRFDTKDVSPVEVTEAVLDRIGRLDGELECYSEVAGERALSAARVAEDEIAAGNHRGVLHGVPVAVKDLCDVAGLRTMAGTAVLRDNVASTDATVVRRLEEAGAVIVGKLNLTEGALAGYNPNRGVPVNPWDTDRWAGVSSSGSGAATAAGLCFGSLGSDTGGSIRFPAAANGVVGLKPTYGRVSRAGVFPLAETFDHVGPLARSSADAAVMLQAIAGGDRADPTSLDAPVGDLRAAIHDGVSGVRIGFDEAWATEGVEPRTVEAVRDALDVLEQAGAEIVPIDMPRIDENLWFVMVGCEAAVAHASYFPERAAEYGGFLAAFLAQGLEIAGTDYAAAQIERNIFSGRLRVVFDSVDVIASPVMARAAFPAPREALRGSLEQVMGLAPELTVRFTAPHDFSGSPTITVPCGFDDDGMPLAVQFAGRHLDEALLCRIGHTFEDLTDWHTRHPIP